MKQKSMKDNTVERRLREVYCSQPSVLPREEWIHGVMAQVRQEALPVRIAEPQVVVVAWRMGWGLALAASLFAILSLTVMPSRDRLAWDYYQGGALAQLSVKMGR